MLTLGFVLAWIMLFRWFVYKTECKVAEVFGWPVVDAMLDFDREHPVKGVGLQPAFCRVACPSVDRRMVRLEHIQRADRSDSPPGRLTG